MKGIIRFQLPFIYTFIVISVFSTAVPLADAAAQAAPTSYLIGFRDSVLKTAVQRGGEQFQHALGTIIPSQRRREVSSKTVGRLKRNIINSIARGQQKHLGFIDAKVVETSRIPDNKKIIGAVGAGLVRYVTPDFRISIAGLPDDPGLSGLWGMNNTKGGFLSVPDIDIDAPEAWDITPGSDSMVVGILDTGIDPTHPDLKENIWVNSGEKPGNGIDDDGNGYIDDVNGCNLAVYNAATTRSCGTKMHNDHDHGTHVAGTIGARGNNGIGISGVAQKVKLVSLAFLQKDGSGTLSDMLEGIEYAIALKKRAGQPGGANIRVINASFGHTEGFTQPEYDAFKKLQDAGILLVAAAGNGGPDGLGDNNDKVGTYPSSYDLDGIISVAAVGRTGTLAYFSNYGVDSVDIGAPGSGISSTVFNGGYASQSGTSMAAPHVAGAAALLLSYQPKLTPWVAKQILMASVKDSAAVAALAGLSGKMAAPGMLDVANALKLSQTDLSTPKMIRSPKSQSAPKGTNVSLSVQAFSTDRLTYRWFKNGKEVSGANKPTLSLKGVQPADAGSYHCVASAGGKTAQSSAATVTVTDKSSSDVNGDGKVDFADVMTLFADFGKKGKGLPSDLNGDGTVDVADLDMLLKAIQP